MLPIALASRAEAELLEEQGRWADALGAWQECAAADRHCTRRAALLAPMAADQFVGWTVLTEVRRDYRSLGSAEATRRIEAALAENPDGPAAAALRAWLSNEYARTEKLPQLEALQAEHPDPLGSLLLEKQQQEQRRQRDVWLSGGLSGLILGVGLLRKGPLAWSSAGLALATLGLPPLLMVWLYDSVWWRSFLASALLIGGVVLLRGRLPLVALLPAFWAGMVAIARLGGWW